MNKDFTLLVIEDDDSSFRLIAAALRTFDITIIHADNGSDGIRLFSENMPNLVLLDIQLPEMDGFEVIEQIRKINKVIPVIAQTAYTLANEKEKCNETGFSDFISKPINIMQLRNIIKKHLAQLN
jgi:CheY-like chemotaxis protein